MSLEAAGISPFFGEIHDFEGFLLERDFEGFFDFGQDHLERDDNDYGFRLGNIYYNNLIDFNALAWSKDGRYLIEVNKGALFHLNRLYTSKKPLFDQEDLSAYRELIGKKGITPEYFLFQFSTLFLFFHEVGHLIQQQMEGPGAEPYVEFLEETILDLDKVRVRHMREFDTDWFGGQQLSFYIKQFAIDLSPVGRAIDREILKMVGSLAVATVYMYFVDRSEGAVDLYFEERTHPHPWVRLNYMIFCVIENLAGNLKVPIPKEEILKEAIRLSELLMTTEDTNVVMVHSLGIYGRIEEIEVYIKQIMENTERYPFLCQHFFNAKTAKVKPRFNSQK
jgi:hypothetical protein